MEIEGLFDGTNEPPAWINEFCTAGYWIHRRNKDYFACYSRMGAAAFVQDRHVPQPIGQRSVEHDVCRPWKRRKSDHLRD